MHAAIDLAADKAETQMRKYKTKVIDRRNHGVSVTKTAAGDSEIKEEEAPPEVVRVKTVDAKPMSEEEAMLQLDLLGHDFFVFRHADTELLNVLYRRNDGDYGLIQPRA
jgi:putative sigma-54 modulation protein